ncbi:MAG TPA: hypothetical protein VNN80_32085, partial [Polyangiaceae bacterium]|nr:hypothetical protein [Polyangiaceae bacterium]
MSQILRLRARAGACGALFAVGILPACAAGTAASPAPATPAAPGDAGGQRGVQHVGPPGSVRVGGREVYLSGFNIAWFDFAKDIGRGVDERRLREVLSDLVAVGGNTLRWWVHTDGTTTPEWGVVDGQRRVVGP